MPFRKVENCNQVVKLGKQLKFSLVNIAGNDIVQGNKKLILGMLSVTFLTSDTVVKTAYCNELPFILRLCLHYRFGSTFLIRSQR